MSLHTKYRPKSFEDMLGQAAIIKSLKKVLVKKTGRSFLLVGPSGTGKTTLARLIADAVGCERHNLVEVDAATNTGIDAMREVTANLDLAALGESPTKVVVVDEVHALSKQAWSSLLKIVEEPPDHVYFIFCTTEAGKVPATIVNRCTAYKLAPVDQELIYSHLKAINKRAKLETADEVLYLIAEQCEGSPRRALTCLSACTGVTSRKEAAALIKTAELGEGDVIELCRALAKGRLQWAKAMELCRKLKDQNAESLRIVIQAYFTAMILNTKGNQRAVPLLAVLETFGTPYPSQSGIGNLVVDLGRLLLTE